MRIVIKRAEISLNNELIQVFLECEQSKKFIGISMMRFFNLLTKFRVNGLLRSLLSRLVSGKKLDVVIVVKKLFYEMFYIYFKNRKKSTENDEKIK